MEDKKFCKFCGEQIDKDSIVCFKCGRQIQNVKNKKENKNNNNNSGVNATNSKSKFYEQTWFMWIMLIFFAPVGIFFMWKFHPEMKKNTKVILTVIFAILFIIIMASNGSETDDNSENTNKYETNKKVEVTVGDFSSMERTDVDTWCNENKVNCKVIDEYSDTIAKGSFVSQSVGVNTTIYEGDRINIVYSLGKKPSAEYTNALKKAESYSRTMHMSKKAIYDQLTSEYGEQFPADAAQYAIDNMTADWNENALAKAKSYQNTMHMSKSAIYDQLISEYGEQFTKEEAQYAIDHLDD